MTPQTEKASSKLLIQHAAYEDVALLDLTAATHAEYCQRWGFDFWRMSHKPDSLRGPEWEQVRLILGALRDGYETIIWLAADAVITDAVDLSAPLAGATAKAIGMAWIEGFYNQTAHQNIPARWDTGVMYLRAKNDTARTTLLHLFEDLWPLWPDRTTHEGRPLDRVINQALRDHQVRVERLTPPWNASPGLRGPAPVVRSWPGLPRDRQLEEMKLALPAPPAPPAAEEPAPKTRRGPFTRRNTAT